MIDKRTITGIILIAGNSTRYGQNRNKNFEKVNGKSIIEYSLEEFNKNRYIDDIIIAVKESEIQNIETIIEKNEMKNIKIVIGGNTRKESVYNCIKNTNSDIVIIHDGARPVIEQKYINECVENMNKFQGVTIGVKSKDTIKITDDNNIVTNSTKRSNTWIIQTPQCFNREILLKMHEKYKNEDVTDDCMLLEKDNYKVKVLEGDYTNIKITTYEDIKIIQGFLRMNKKNKSFFL